MKIYSIKLHYYSQKAEDFANEFPDDEFDIDTEDGRKALLVALYNYAVQDPRRCQVSVYQKDTRSGIEGIESLFK